MLKAIEDSEFLKEFIAAVSLLAKTVPNQIITIKNCDSEHIFFSDYLLQLIGKPAAELLGQKVWLFLYDNDSEFEKIIVQEDRIVIDQKKPQIVFKVNKFKCGLLPYVSVKSPIINPNTDRVVGVLFQGFELGFFALNYFFSAGNLQKNCWNKEDSRIKLSKREKQVVFFFLAHLSSQEIAEMIYKIEGKRVAKSTIDGVFNNQLYIKFNVNSRPELYAKLQQSGYGQMIPTEVLKGQSVVLDGVKLY